ncbi:MAG: sulfate reduction electron transfer complex DsrMKJOP subunit DsrM [Deltaproteobacteria bacterium]|nr:sulfate reduction electron transfer complex DsrMKJOP subunit DsrM [Deltaproteobacteria bacterium]
MRAFTALLLVAGLVGIAVAAARVPALGPVVTVALPYAAVAVFLLGLVVRVVRWARAPVPFRITTTCGQQRSLPWLKSQELESPSGTLGVIGRMALEVLCFRSLFRNTRVRVGDGGRVVHGDRRWLWLAALAFHWSLLLVLTRHLRFFVEPVPGLVLLVQHVDGFFQIGVPELFVTTFAITLALAYLAYRRFANPQVRYVSLVADYFPLFLLLTIVGSGILMRHFAKTDVAAIKELAVGLSTFHPRAPSTLSPVFAVHLLLVSVLLAYFPFSKLVHMAGVFLSPTRNLANDNRARRHVNPWDPDVKTHAYEEWEHEFHDKLTAAGIPLQGAPPPPAAGIPLQGAPPPAAGATSQGG